MKYLILLLLSLSLEAKWEDWSEKEKDLYKNFIYLNAIDIDITYNVIKNFDSAYEINPIFGKDPSLEQMIITKAISAAIIYKLLDNNSHRVRERELKIINTVYMGIVIHNGYIGFDLRKNF